MLPTFFPSSYVNTNTLNKLFNWFEQVVIYQPSDLDIPKHYDTFISNKKLIIRTPLQPLLDKEHLIQERLHLQSIGNDMGANMTHIKGMPENPPFYNDLSVNHIKSQIKKSQKNDKFEHKPLLTSLFLHLIQDYEIQNDDLNQKMIEIEKTEKELFQMLKDEKPDDLNLTQNNSIQNNCTPEHKMNILKSWFYMYQNDSEKTGIFLTNNQDFFSEIEEWNPNLKLTFSFNDQLLNANLKNKLFKRIHEYVNGQNNIQTDDLKYSKDVNPQNINLYSQQGQLKGPFIHENNLINYNSDIVNTCLFLFNE